MGSGLEGSGGPLRVGLLGLGRDGLFHLERLSLRSDLLPVAVVDADPARASLGETFDCRVYNDSAAFLADAGIELVLISLPAGQRADLVIAAVKGGGPVAVVAPLALSETEADRVRQAAAAASSRLAVLSPLLGSDDFQAARATIAAGRVGQVTALKHLAWDFTGEQGGSEPGAADDGLLCHVADTLEQLLLLAGTAPRTVTARRLDAGLQVVVEFEGGVVADVEYHPTSPVPLRTGWVVAGSTGGYRDFKYYTLTDEQEVYPTRIEPPEIDQDRCYLDLLEQLNDERAWQATLARAGQVVAMLSATVVSLREGAPVVVTR